jgi:methylated-DNA-[protein]-cysteine S-methyltransferase
VLTGVPVVHGGLGVDAPAAAGEDVAVQPDSQVQVTEAAMAQLDSPVGPVVLTATADGIAEVAFGDPDLRPGRTASQATRAARRRAVQHLDRAVSELAEYFAGDRQQFEVPLDLTWAPPFQLGVLRALQNVPFGATASYGQLAAAAGRPGAARAVGTACGRNRLAVIIPCHRVVRADGSLGGYASGLARKRWLLAHEGVLPEP